MANYLFILTRGPEDATRCVRCMHLVKIAAEKGHDTTLFLTDEAVLLAHLGLTERIKAPTGDELMTYYKGALDSGARILACKPCSEAREIGEDDLPPGWEMGSGYDAIDLADQPDTKVFTF